MCYVIRLMVLCVMRYALWCMCYVRVGIVVCGTCYVVLFTCYGLGVMCYAL